MGSSASKPAGRKLAQTVTSQVRAGAGAPVSRPAAASPAAPGSGPTSASRGVPRSSNAAAFQAGQSQGPKPYGYEKHSASETKTREIMEDAGDPTLLQNLQRLGAVDVEHPHSPLNDRNSYHGNMIEILAARARDVAQSEEGAEDAYDSPSDGTARAAQPLRLSPSTIATLLDERKDCMSKKDLETLALEYDIPVDVIETLGRYFNTPSVSESMGQTERLARMRLDEDHEGPPLVYAVWTDPVLEEAPKRLPG
ncbi:unnamed protein product [Tilletia laevis]|uniref:Uncharacterized protein n=3 Tax=Tilletia TaxID=13289 RepID=A0A8X7MYT2_9BASI|nr:hypothetical protein CF336_g2820 [Tilletia laevis]KAE8198352.1 hypothetical protein CF328_g3581 [Tilletia controversa]KAE8261413.1 hypothetical protein A4X03_0g3282 [Tilletia caries]KAE8204164.1 hypothetical protein CF335_g2757 [Tilletia laevis]KAE8253936.1 hypothetical protein A4X06_0g1146 [Tilletia controversa]